MHQVGPKELQVPSGGLTELPPFLLNVSEIWRTGDELGAFPEEVKSRPAIAAFAVRVKTGKIPPGQQAIAQI
jgi:hypothetical protein